MATESDNSGFNLPSDPVVDFWKSADVAGHECSRLREEGCEHFKKCALAEAVASFDAAARAKPECAPYLWQRGIAKYYCGDFQGAVDQFVSGQAVNANDTEEVIWEMLSRSKIPDALAGDGADSTLVGKLKCILEPRPIMAVVQALFARSVPADRLAHAVTAGGSTLNEAVSTVCKDIGEFSQQDLFYLWFYLALFADMEGRTFDVKVALDTAFTVGYADDDYMLHVARVHRQNCCSAE